MKKLKQHAQDRGYFEADQVFPDSLQFFLDAYEMASERAATKARFAVSNGGMTQMRIAQWYEAVASTLEVCIHNMLFMGNKNEQEFRIPPPPSFED